MTRHRRGAEHEGLLLGHPPKPEFGTIEIRVFDTPLTIERAAALAGYVQCAGGVVSGRASPSRPPRTTTCVYTYNRFQACRFGLDAGCMSIRPRAAHLPLREQILRTMEHHRPPHAHSACAALLRCAAMRRAPERCPLAARMPGAHAAAGRVSRQAALRFRQVPPMQP